MQITDGTGKAVWTSLPRDWVNDPYMGPAQLDFNLFSLPPGDCALWSGSGVFDAAGDLVSLDRFGLTAAGRMVVELVLSADVAPELAVGGLALGMAALVTCAARRRLSSASM